MVIKSDSYLYAEENINRVAGTIITYIAFILVLYLVLNSVLPILSDEINEFAKNVPIILDKIQVFVDGIFDKFENPAFDINATKLELYTKVESAVIEYTSKLPEISINVIKGVFSTLWSIVLGFMIGLYLLFDFDNAIKKQYHLFQDEFVILYVVLLIKLI